MKIIFVDELYSADADADSAQLGRRCGGFPSNY
jgi:hypothetical protein